ncbi:helix-turn-helix domain-containing protein [Aureimonas phyllosphaerae]|uniref:helix-turn-helix domain-containing protein n=1 Tax=Aureimonas phyllosphaerae TaxID=1166078 RepID=UPI003A5C61F6
MDHGPSCTIGEWRSQASFRHSVSSPEQLELLNEVGAIAIDFLPFARPLTSDLVLQGAQSQTFCCWATSSRSGFVSVPKHEADVITIRFIESGRMIRRNGQFEHVGLPGHAMFVAFKDMRNEEASEGFSSFGGTISRDGLLRGHRALEGDGTAPPFLVPIAPSQTREMRAFKSSFVSLMARLETGAALDDHWLALLEEIIVYQLLTAWPRQATMPSPRPGEPIAVERISRALEFVEDNLAKPFRLEDVARAAGISVRSLQQNFQKFRSCSPTQYVTRRRLERVNEDLRTTYRDELSIAAAARRWGFTHMSDFGRQYRAHFGHVPRATPRKPYR